MKLVRENIEFKRGIKPKEALELGGETLNPLTDYKKKKEFIRKEFEDFIKSLEGKRIKGNLWIKGKGSEDVNIKIKFAKPNIYGKQIIFTSQDNIIYYYNIDAGPITIYGG